MEKTFGLDVHKDSVFACILDELANPYFIKQLPGRKSDVKDAR
ncbi:hypothetical protein SDC9_140061 [bioreactor metagenome]|uniref:IS110 family transposase n=1 Tax=bioreactor metagenome TaxID=1076179 RepID=A0A645DUG9_9ZZZZ